MKRLIYTTILCAAVGACATSGPSSDTAVSRQSAALEQTPTAELPPKPEAAATYLVFKPAPAVKRNRVTIDYAIWGEMLRAMVIYMGPSERTRASRPEPMVGTRLIQGHDSAFRLEGNKIFFSGLDDELKSALTEYKIDLERVGNQVDITRLNRNEQLAYWLNLYNAITIEQIAIKYPMQNPSTLKVGPGKEPLDVAKLVTIKGVPLSLNDIRTQIVYPNWSDAKVIYGFFRGDLGGPTIQSSAFTRENITSQLDRNAREYVNSLRGAYKTRNAVKVSRIYEEARPFFFANWPADIKNHLIRFMDLEVQVEFDFTLPIEFQIYETRVADLSGGEPFSAKSNITSSDIGSAAAYNLPASALRMMRELSTKVENLKEQGKLRGRVIIVDEITLPSREEEDRDQVK